MVHADSQSVLLQISAPAGFDEVNGILQGSAAVSGLCLQSTMGQRLGEPQPSAVISTPLNTPLLPRSHCPLLGKGHYSSLIGHVASHLRPDGACLCHPLWLEWRARCVCCSHLEKTGEDTQVRNLARYLFLENIIPAPSPRNPQPGCHGESTRSQDHKIKLLGTAICYRTVFVHLLSLV